MENSLANAIGPAMVSTLATGVPRQKILRKHGSREREVLYCVDFLDTHESKRSRPRLDSGGGAGAWDALVLAEVFGYTFGEEEKSGKSLHSATAL